MFSLNIKSLSVKLNEACNVLQKHQNNFYGRNKVKHNIITIHNYKDTKIHFDLSLLLFLSCEYGDILIK